MAVSQVLQSAMKQLLASCIALTEGRHSGPSIQLCLEPIDPSSPILPLAVSALSLTVQNGVLLTTKSLGSYKSLTILRHVNDLTVCRNINLLHWICQMAYRLAGCVA